MASLRAGRRRTKKHIIKRKRRKTKTAKRKRRQRRRSMRGGKWGVAGTSHGTYTPPVVAKWQRAHPKQRLDPTLTTGEAKELKAYKALSPAQKTQYGDHVKAFTADICGSSGCCGNVTHACTPLPSTMSPIELGEQQGEHSAASLVGRRVIETGMSELL